MLQFISLVTGGAPGKRLAKCLGAGAFVMLATAMPSIASAATVNAASCSLTDVQAAIAAAQDGDTVAVPAGACTWSGNLALTKGIHLRGAGVANTRITMGGTISLTKHPTRRVELSGFLLSKSGGGNAARILVVTGPWSAQPPLIHDNTFQVNNSGAIRYETNGGVIYRNTFVGTWDESAIQHKIVTDTESWSTPDTFGTRDSSGARNLYVEDNVFRSMPNQATDFDDGSRVVFRYNELVNSSFNSHGLDTSPIGIRHFEIYRNNFRYPDINVNQNWHVWLRGGTGVVYDNSFDDINGQQWGNKTEMLFSVRSVIDGGVEGCCRTYPCKHQVGQNSSGTQQFTDAVRFWNNAGTLNWGLNSSWSNSCGGNMADFVQNGRDLVFGSTPKSGYTAYAYPHPLRTPGATPPPAAPSALRAQ
jgi:hypothetical protein